MKKVGCDLSTLPLYLIDLGAEKGTSRPRPKMSKSYNTSRPRPKKSTSCSTSRPRAKYWKGAKENNVKGIVHNFFIFGQDSYFG